MKKILLMLSIMLMPMMYFSQSAYADSGCTGNETFFGLLRQNALFYSCRQSLGLTAAQIGLIADIGGLQAETPLSYQLSLPAAEMVSQKP